MRSKQRKTRLALVLLLPSLAAYAGHYALFRNAHDIVYYLLLDLAFLFVQVLLVTLVLERLLTARDRQAAAKKVNLLVGVFFSQVGTPLLKRLGAFDGAVEDLVRRLAVGTNADFAAMHAAVARHESRIDTERGDLSELRSELIEERGFLMRLLENPSLIEHDTFTELLWSVFHLTEELAHRHDLVYLTDSDRKHLETDIQRAYHLLLREWLDYLQHLQSDYPYLFSLAARTNPFDPTATVQLDAEPTTTATTAN